MHDIHDNTQLCVIKQEDVLDQEYQRQGSIPSGSACQDQDMEYAWVKTEAAVKQEDEKNDQFFTQEWSESKFHNDEWKTKPQVYIEDDTKQESTVSKTQPMAIEPSTSKDVTIESECVAIDSAASKLSTRKKPHTCNICGKQFTLSLQLSV